MMTNFDNFIVMLQVLLILLETRTSIVLYTDINTDLDANINIAKRCTSLIQIEFPTLLPVPELI